MSLTNSTRISRALPTALACLATWIVVGHAALADNPEVMQAGDTLYILGDNSANTLTIVGAKDAVGKLAVYIHEDPWIYEGVENIEIDLAGGDNELRMARIKIPGDLTVVADDGTNVVLLGRWKDYGTSFIQGDVSITTGNGNNGVKLEDNWVGGSVNVNSGDGINNVRIGAPFSPLSLGFIDTIGNSILGDLTLATGAGDDIVWIMKSSVLGHTQIVTAQGEDYVYLGFDPDVPRSRDQRKGSPETSNTFLGLTIETGNDGDYVGLKGNDLYMETTIEMGGGGDDLYLEDANRFNGALDAHGENGRDVLYDDPANYYAVPPVFNGFEL